MKFVKILVALLIMGLAVASQASAQIRSAEVELFVKNGRIEVQVTSGESTEDEAIGGVVTDGSVTETAHNDSFLGAGLGPIFLGGRQNFRSHKFFDLVDSEASERNTQEVFGSISIPSVGLPGDLLAISIIQESGLDAWSKDLPDLNFYTDTSIKTEESRIGVIYIAKYIGVGYWRGTGKMVLDDQSTGGARVLENIEYTTHDTLVGLKMDDGNGFILNLILLDSDAELDPGLVYTVRLKNSEEQAAELGYRFNETSKMTIFYGLTDENMEVIQFDTALSHRININRTETFYGLGVQFHGFGLSVKQETYKYSVDEVIGTVLYDGNQTGTLNSVSVNWDF